ncbi:MAG: hypothetical protein RL693_74 [Verrucomicrobiota bacterium]|jgi:hypothetical protein
MNWISIFPFDSTFICVACAHITYWLGKLVGQTTANISMALFLSPLALLLVISLFVREERKYALTSIGFLALVSSPLWFSVIR